MNAFESLHRFQLHQNPPTHDEIESVCPNRPIAILHDERLLALKGYLSGQKLDTEGVPVNRFALAWSDGLVNGKPA